MALTRSNKVWILAIIYLLLVVLFIDWLERRFHAEKNLQKTPYPAHEIKK